MRKAGLCAAAVLASAALAAPADANRIKLRGNLVGNPSAQVKMAVNKERGEIRRVTGIRFFDVPVTCADGTSGAISAQLRGFGVHGKKFSRRGPLRGVGIHNGFLRVGGKLRRGGRVVKGKVRFAFRNDAGAGCGTDRVAWKAKR